MNCNSQLYLITREVKNGLNFAKSFLQSLSIFFAKDCQNSPKLRTYNSLFSPDISYNFDTSYTRHILPFIHRKRLAQLRLGCLPLRVETDRFTRPIVPSHERFCLQPLCSNTTDSLPDENKQIEDEFHFLIKCRQYDQLRNVLFSSVETPGFIDFSDKDKFIYLLTSRAAVKIVAQFIADSFDQRPAK